MSETNQAALVMKALIALAVLVGLVSIWTTLVRSGFEMEFDARVTAVVQRHGEGADQDVWLVYFDGDEAVHLDEAVAQRLASGDHIEKRRFSFSWSTSNGSFSARPSNDVLGSCVATAAVVAGLVVLKRRSPTLGSP